MSAESKTVIVAALAGNAVIAVTKFAAAAVSGSSAMLAEGIHSVVDTGNQGLMLLGLARARRPADARFPFGHGKEIYFWSFVVALSIFAVGAGVSLYEGIIHLFHPAELGDPLVNYVVLAIAIAAEGAAWWFAWKGFRAAKGPVGSFRAVREGKDPTLFVVLFEDSAALLGL
ncbi:MAG TPA: cation diffusion facilitator family transporter, partial [Gammaproteobacteria bacterium]|nr:cation diffusion facilitator family transporter [Gammaproteobacteria bacterium]